jgi:hypothetical protein
MIKWRALYLFVSFFNFWIGEIGWRLFHCQLSVIFGYWQYKLSLRFLIFQASYILALEFFTNRFIWPTKERLRIWFLGEEIKEDIREEIEKIKDK